MQARILLGWFCLSVVLMPHLVAAQTIVGRISGTVTDSSGAVLPGVTITITNAGTGLTWSATTSESGAYVVTNLPVGTYRVQALMEGFQPAARIGLALTPDGRLAADFTLGVGGRSETVSVQAVRGEIVNRTSGEIARTIDGSQVRELALNGRNYLQLASLIPGAVLLSSDPIAQTTSLTTTGQSINGTRDDASSLTVDGGFNLEYGSNGSQFNNVGVDFIDQVKIQTSNFSAELGRASGASINVVTRSGTSELRGSVFGFLRDDSFDATNYFAPRDSSNRPIAAPLSFKVYGGAVGGPLVRRRAFFFVGQERRSIDRADGPFRRTLPTTAELSGDFSQRLAGADGVSGTADDGVLRDPATGQAFAGNRVPEDRITVDGRAVASAYLAMIGRASSFQDAPIGNNATYQLAFPFDGRQDIVRLDYRISDAHSVYLRYLHDENDLIEPRGSFNGAELPTSPTHRVRPGTSYQLAYTWTVSPTIVYDTKFNAAWQRQRTRPEGDTWRRDTYGFVFPQLYPGGTFNEGIPDVALAGYAGLTGPSSAAITPTTDLQFQNTLTWLRGSHSVRTGFGIIRNRKDANARPPYTGSVSFSAPGNPASTGQPVADALLGNFRTYSEGSAEPMVFYRFTQYAAYVSDTWRVSSKLSVELGLRFESAAPTYTLGNNFVNFDPGLYDPAQAVTVQRNGQLVPGSGFRFNGLIRAGDGVPAQEQGRVDVLTGPDFDRIPTGAPRALYEPHPMWMPRVSGAWSLSERTALRGGVGLFYEKQPVTNITGNAQLPPFLEVSQFENGNLADPSGGQPTALAPMGAINAIDPALRQAYQVNFSASVQHELGHGLFVEAAYVGNRGRRLLRRPDVNQPPFEVLAANAALSSAERASVNALRPYAGYSQILQLRSDAISNYNALQLYLTRRQGALRFTAGYTLSRALTDASGRSDNPEDPFNRAFNYGPASFDRRHVLVSTFTGELPWYRDRHSLLGYVAGGWELSGIVRWQSGPYLTVSGNTSIGTRRGDYLGGDIDLPGDARNADRWFNTDAFAEATDDRRGTAGVGQIQGPHYASVDLSLRKRVPIGPRVRVGVQADVFNVFNRVNLGIPTTNVTSVAFGQITSANPARQVQLGVRLEF